MANMVLQQIQAAIADLQKRMAELEEMFTAAQPPVAQRPAKRKRTNA